MDKCPFCEAGVHDHLYYTVFNCMSYIKNGKIWRLSPCYEAELTTLRSLVREMGLVISKLTLGKAEILNRPEVKAIMENIGPKDMPHSEDLVYPQNR